MNAAANEAAARMIAEAKIRAYENGARSEVEAEDQAIFFLDGYEDYSWACAANDEIARAARQTLEAVARLRRASK